MSKILKYKKIIFVVLGVVLVTGLIWAGLFYWKNLRGAWPILKKVSYETILTETGDLPFELPEGFSMEIFAEDLPGARVLVQDGLGNFWVSQPKKGKITLLEVSNGKVTRQETVFENLNNPHGLAIDPNDPLVLYIAEEHEISRARLYAEGIMETLLDLSSGGRHTTRTINFGPDGRLYISIGSSCDVCVEKDKRRAAIYSMEKDGRDFRKLADGLRNAVFFDWSYIDGRMWATEMGRDLLGDNLPPDEINIIKESRFYGWPYCYGKNIQDKTFDDSGRAGKICEMAEPSYIDIPAHSSPLGLAFIPEEQGGWPQEYWYDLLVVYHGSWNRTEPTGYKIVRIDLDDAGNPIDNGRLIHDFITGWLTDRGTIGRPVDLFIQPGGLMYITDDGAGVVYKVTYMGEGYITSFEECAIKYPVMESYPRQCRVPSGKLFIEDIGNELEKQDLIFIDSPRPNETVTSPLFVHGEARGFWFFEADFPIFLRDSNGNELARGIAQSKGEWMTEDFVPYEAVLFFEKPVDVNEGVLILRKDNPSDLSENDDELIVPIKFVNKKQAGDNRSRGGCVITGCSGQICADEQVVTICEFRPEYGCYKSAVCERQANNQCNWTLTESLVSCLGEVNAEN